MVYQKTIQSPATLKGIGLHTGKQVTMTFLPAPENSGVYFVRADLPGKPSVKATWKNVKATEMATVLGADLFQIYTIEHCMSALGALGIDNLTVELDGPELPIGDGSAAIFFDSLSRLDIVEQRALRTYIYITHPIYFASGDKYAYVVPYNGFKITCSIDFAHPRIGKQKIELEISREGYGRDLSRARTFGFLKDVEALQKKGLALGGSLENAVVLDDHNILNPEGLRYSDEFVRHKAMDAMGDIMLLGYPMVGHFVLHKAGHDLMHGFTQKILSSTDHYRFLELAAPLAQPLGDDRLYAHLVVG